MNINKKYPNMLKFIKQTKRLSARLINPIIGFNSNNNSNNNNNNNDKNEHPKELRHLKILSDGSSYRLRNGRYYLVYECESKTRIVFKLFPTERWPHNVYFSAHNGEVIVTYKRGEGEIIAIPKLDYEKCNWRCIGIINCLRVIKRATELYQRNDAGYVKPKFVDIIMDNYRILGVYMTYEYRDMIIFELYNRNNLPTSVYTLLYERSKVALLLYQDYIVILNSLENIDNFIGIVNNNKITSNILTENISLFDILKPIFIKGDVRVIESCNNYELIYVLKFNNEQKCMEKRNE